MKFQWTIMKILCVMWCEMMHASAKNKSRVLQSKSVPLLIMHISRIVSALRKYSIFVDNLRKIDLTGMIKSRKYEAIRNILLQKEVQSLIPAISRFMRMWNIVADWNSIVCPHMTSQHNTFRHNSEISHQMLCRSQNLWKLVASVVITREA